MSDAKSARAHLITGGFPPGSMGGHDHDYARLKLPGILAERRGRRSHSVGQVSVRLTTAGGVAPCPPRCVAWFLTVGAWYPNVVGMAPSRSFLADSRLLTAFSH